MKYIKTFENREDYTDWTESQNYVTPNLAYCVYENEAQFEKRVRDYSKEYFTIEALEDGNVYFKYDELASTQVQRYMEYSTDYGKTWTKTSNIDNDSVIITVSMTEGQRAFFRGDNDTLNAGVDENKNPTNSGFYSGIEVNVYGNVMSLLYDDDFENTTTLSDYAFQGLCSGGYWKNDKLLVYDAANLILPSMTLTTGCYFNMFSGCTTLRTAPELPATTMANRCYASMFTNCTSLTTAPELPATTLADSCYSYMFSHCTSLTASPELPATTLQSNCYDSMFYGCTSLTNVGYLSFTGFASNARGCCMSMFSTCTSLTEVNQSLQPTTLVTNCYQSMFSGCRSLTKAPLLPATTLSDSCYYAMFLGCTSLVNAPVLPAISLPYRSNCYGHMFDGCSRLNYVKAMFTSINGSDNIYYWLRNVGSGGTFVKNSEATWQNSSVVPSGWTVVTEQPKGR